MISEFFSVLLEILFLLNILFALLIIFYERKNPSSTLAWIMVLVFVPYFGFLLYLVMGHDSRKYVVFSEKSRQDTKYFQEYNGYNRNQQDIALPSLTDFKTENISGIPDMGKVNDLIYLNLMSGHGSFTDNNHITVFSLGEEKFNAMIEDIRLATDFIFIEYYIVRNDQLAQRLINALADAAKRGVEVKMLIDGMGCQFTPKRIFAPLKEAGGQLGIFLSPMPVRINFRNHRKICSIDGHIGYIGGLNVGNEYLGKVKRYGYWRDMHIKITGDAVHQLTLRFVMDWNFCSQHPLTISSKYFPSMPFFGVGAKIQIVSSGPDTKWPSIQQSYFKMICEADHSIYIQTPYFVPDESILESLKIQALSGIDVRIVFPGNPDHPFVYWASLSNMGQLLEAGVRCYEYTKGFLHSKLMTIDGVITSVGTANMDLRSFKLNFEINAFIFDAAVTEEFNEIFLADLNDCREITMDSYNQRGFIVKAKESISRLLSPLL